MSQQSRVTIVAELKDKLTGPARKAQQSAEDMGKAVEDSGKRAEKAHGSAGKAAEGQAKDTDQAARKIDKAMGQAAKATEQVDKAISATGAKWGDELTGMVTDTDQAASRIDRALARAGVTGGRRMTENLRDAGSRFVREAASIGKRAGDKIAQGIESALETINSSPIAGLVGTGTVVGGAASAMQRDSMARAWAAAEGLDPEQARALADTTYAMGKGEDYGQVLEAAGGVVSTFDLEPGSPEAQALLVDNLDMAKAFGVENSQLAMAVKIVSDLDGSSLQDAQDVIAASLQNAPRFARDELIDAFNEYAAVLEGTGVSAANLGYVLSEAGSSGSMAVDKQGDALKEWAVRAASGDTTSEEAYGAVGMDIADVSSRLRAGDMSALNDTAAKLLEVEDPHERSVRAIEIFGTPMEDIGPAQVEEQLEAWAALDAQIGDVEGTLDGMQDTMGEGPGREWTQLLRAMEQSLVAIGDHAAPVLIPLFDALTFMAPVIGPLAAAFSGLWLAVSGYRLVAGVLGFLGLAGDKSKAASGAMKGLSRGVGLLGAAMKWLGALMLRHPLFLIAAILYGVGKAMGWLYDNVGWIREGFDTLSGTMSTVMGFFDDMGTAIDTLVREKFPALHSALDLDAGPLGELSNALGGAGDKLGKESGVQEWLGTGEHWGSGEGFLRFLHGADAGEGQPAHADGGWTGSGAHTVTVGERGREFVVPSGAANTLEAHEPGALDAIATGRLPQSGPTLTYAPTVYASGPNAADIRAQVAAALAEERRELEHMYGTMSLRGGH